MSKWRMLDPSEKVEHGDEYFSCGSWIESLNWTPENGGRQHSFKYRRRVLTSANDRQFSPIRMNGVPNSAAESERDLEELEREIAAIDAADPMSVGPRAKELPDLLLRRDRLNGRANGMHMTRIQRVLAGLERGTIQCHNESVRTEQVTADTKRLVPVSKLNIPTLTILGPDGSGDDVA